MPYDQRRVKAVFDEAMTKSCGPVRTAYLEQACEGEAELQERVEALLAAHDGTGGFIDLPTPVGEGVPLPQIEAIGDQIGPYKLLEQIGEGGFGVVFLAEQRAPIRRRVALKILKPGMDTRQVVARFQAERQALALMDHPQIAKVFDTGATASGRPYFVMELVKGIAITDYCNQCSLPTEARLKLFIMVCKAIQHAHQKGVIHRDVKPSNVLVEMRDGEANVKVIDFGVAKAVNQRLTDDSLHTGFAQMLGTPMYMSPEQAEMSPLEIDTRSDIYSLGVLLYELLTGTTPFSRERLKQANFDELRRIIRQEEPPLPSARLSTLNAEQARTVCDYRRTDSRKLIQQVRGDLDWIVMKALDKERSRRYETANGLARDIERFLNEEPVEASPPNTRYRMKKFLKRHRLWAIGTSAVVTALLVGAVGTTLGWLEALAQRKHAEQAALDERAARKAAEAETARADRSAQQATTAKEFIFAILGAAQSTGATGETPSSEIRVIDVVNGAASALDRLAAEPQLQLDSYRITAEMYTSLHADAAARDLLGQAAAISARTNGADAETTLQFRVDSVYSATRVDVNEDLLESARNVAKDVERRFRDSHVLTCDAQNNVGLVLIKLDRPVEAEPIFRSLVERVEMNPGAVHPKGSARYYHNLGLALENQGRMAEAVLMYGKATTVASAEPQTDAWRLSNYYIALASAQMQERQYDDAVDSWNLSLKAARRLPLATGNALAIVSQLIRLNYHLERPQANKVAIEYLEDRSSAGFKSEDARSLIARISHVLLQLESSGVTEKTDRQMNEDLDVLYGNVDEFSDAYRLAASMDASYAIARKFLTMPRWQDQSLFATAQVLSDSALLNHASYSRMPAPQWGQARYMLRRWTGGDESESQAAIAMDLETLAKTRLETPGVYLLSVVIPRENAVPARSCVWICAADWDVSSFGCEEGVVHNQDSINRLLQGGMGFDSKRTIPYWHNQQPLFSFSPINSQLTGFVIRARTTFSAPPGSYAVNIDLDAGGLIVEIDGVRPENMPQVIDFSGGSRAFELIWSQGGSICRFHLRPQHPMATEWERDATPWQYIADARIEGIEVPAKKNATLSAERAKLLLSRGDFSLAVDEFENTLELNSADHLSAYQLAVLLAYLNRTTEYAALCDRIVKQFGQDQDLNTGERTAKACLVLPLSDSHIDVESLRTLVDRAVAKGTGVDLAWFQFAKGLFEYRCGNFSESFEWFDRSRQVFRTFNLLPVPVNVELYRAMAMRNTGKKTEGRKAFDDAVAEFQKNRLVAGTDDLQREALENWLAYEIAYREAQALFEMPESPEAMVRLGEWMWSKLQAWLQRLQNKTALDHLDLIQGGGFLR